MSSETCDLNIFDHLAMLLLEMSVHHYLHKIMPITRLLYTSLHVGWRNFFPLIILGVSLHLYRFVFGHLQYFASSHWSLAGTPISLQVIKTSLPSMTQPQFYLSIMVSSTAVKLYSNTAVHQ
jgi:hypothetical protein